MNERIVVSGGSGFIGRLLTPKLVAANYDVVVLSRSPRSTAETIRQVRWDGRTLGDWTEELDGARALQPPRVGRPASEAWVLPVVLQGYARFLCRHGFAGRT
jgi:nucleoside-diphosphate-sugar epimerase